MSATNQGLTDLQAQVAALTTISQTGAAALQSLEQQVTALQNQQAEVTDAQLETLAQTVKAANATISAALPAAGVPPTAPATPATS